MLSVVATPAKRCDRVDKGDERRVLEVDHRSRSVLLEGRGGGRVAWRPDRIAGRHGGCEVYRVEEIELRAGDRVRWTRNDKGLGLVNSRSAEVVAVGEERVSFRLEDGRRMDLGPGDPQLRHLDHAWASTVHAFQGRTVDNVIAAMEAEHPHLTTQKSFYVEISRARDRAELVTDDAARLRERLELTTGERISALEAVQAAEGASPEPEPVAKAPHGLKPEEPERAREREREKSAPPGLPAERGDGAQVPKDRRPEEQAREKSVELELDL